MSDVLAPEVETPDQVPAGVDTAASSDVPAAAAAAAAGPQRPEDVVVPPKPEKVNKPNEEQHKARLAELEAEMNQVRKRIEAIRAQMDKKGSERDSGSKESSAALEKLKEIQVVIRSKNTEREAAMKQSEELKTLRDKKIAELEGLKSTAKFSKVEDVDRELARIEQRLTTESLSLPEEKRMLQDKSQLTASKPAIRLAAQKQEELNAIKTQMRTLSDDINARFAEWRALKDQETAARAAWEQTKVKQTDQVKSQPSLYEELKAQKEKRQLIVTQLNTAREEFSKEMRAFRQYDRQFREYQQALRKRQYLERRVERQDRDEARKEEDGQFDPLAPKRELCATLVQFLERVQAQNTTQKQAQAAAPEAESLPDDAKGKYVRSSKFSQERVVLAAKKPAAKQTAPTAPSAPVDKTNERLTLSVALFSQFGELHIDPPVTVGQIPATVTALKAKAEALAAESAKAAAKRAAAKAAASDAAPAAAAEATTQTVSDAAA